MVEKKKVAATRSRTESVRKWPTKIGPLSDGEKQEILKIVEREVEKDSQLGMNCAERTFGPVHQAFEKWTEFPKEIIKLSSGFGGGGACTGMGFCGVVSGGLMALGLFWGRVEPMDYFRTAGLNSVEEATKNPMRRDAFYRIYNYYIKEFKNCFGSVICADLIKDFLDSSGFYILDAKLEEDRKTLCKGFITWGASRVAQLILEGQEKGIQHMEMGHNKWNMK
jgi:C_GCAxxG_C_C family probable redox protein